MYKRLKALEGLYIRISSICFILSLLGCLLYAGWVEADRFFNARTFILNQVQRDHGIRLKVESPLLEGKNVLLADKSEVSLGKHGSGVLEGIRVGNHQLHIKSASFQVFDDNPWQWVSGLCGDGLQIQVYFENLSVKTALGKTYSLGKFEISSASNHGIKGVCDLFTVEEWGEKTRSVNGDLTSIHAAFEKGSAVGFIKYTTSKNSREVNGLGAVTMETTAIDSLVFQLKRPVSYQCAWIGKEAKGFLQSEGLDLEIKLTPEAVSIHGFGKSKGFEWYGHINADEEQYQLFVAGVTLIEILKSGLYSEKYKVPENFQNPISGACEIRRDRKSGKLSVFIDSENKRFALEEVSH